MIELKVNIAETKASQYTIYINNNLTRILINSES